MPVPLKRYRCKPVPSVRVATSSSKAKRARYALPPSFFRAFVSKNETNSCAPVQSRTGCWAFYARFECAPTRFTLFEFLWWRLKRFIMRFTPDCVQKNPLTFLFLLYSPLASSSLQYSQFTFREQVIDVSTSKTGKHGHAKCHFVAEDIFTGKRCDELVPAGHNLEVPVFSPPVLSLFHIYYHLHMFFMVLLRDS